MVYPKKHAIVFLMLFFCISLCRAERHCVILAGGSGERLWPLSNNHTPKQLLSVDGKKTLLEQAIERVTGVVPQENIWICTTQSLYEPIKQMTEGRINHIIIEPDKRDTAPAIIYSCLKIREIDSDALVLFTASDAYIPYTSYNAFRSYLEMFYIYATQNAHTLTLFGVKPTYPATGYGYIEYDTLTRHSGIFNVTQFHEKPNIQTAQTYLEMGTMLWNMGIFGGFVSTFIHEYMHHAPDIVTTVQEHMLNNTPYNEIRKVSIDYAVLEKSNNITVLPVEFPWCDVGNLRVFLSLQQSFNIQQSQVISHKATNNFVHAPGTIALVGVENLCIVQKDDILLICHQDCAEDIKTVAAIYTAKEFI